MTQLQLSRGQFAHWMERVGEVLIAYVAGTGGLTALDQTFEVSLFLARSGQKAAAADLIRSGLRAALEVEKFELALRLLRIREMAGGVETNDIMPDAQLLLFKRNLSDYEQLFTDFELATQEKEFALRRERIHSLLQTHLLSSREKALSHRAAYYFYRLRLNCLVHLGEYEFAIIDAQHLLDLLRKKSWVHDDPEFMEAKCLSVLAQLLRLTNQFSQLDQVAQELGNQHFSSSAATEVQLFFRFPSSIAIAIQRGEKEALEKATEEFIALWEARNHDLSPQYVTENLCQSLYGAFAAGSQDRWISLLRSLRNFRKVDFKPQYYTFYRFLFLAKAIETKDWDECRRQIKNLRVGTTLDCFLGLRKAIDRLSSLISVWDQRSGMNSNVFEAGGSSALLADCEDLEFTEYFDFHSWILSLESGCSLLEAIRERASH